MHLTSIFGAVIINSYGMSSIARTSSFPKFFEILSHFERNYVHMVAFTLQYFYVLQNYDLRVALVKKTHSAFVTKHTVDSSYKVHSWDQRNMIRNAEIHKKQ